MCSPKSDDFDCVQSMRQIRDRLSREIAHLSHDELTQWLRSHQYTEPLLQRLADRAAQQARVADGASPRH
jgi:hypothetical protein